MPINNLLKHHLYLFKNSAKAPDKVPLFNTKNTAAQLLRSSRFILKTIKPKKTQLVALES